MAGGRHRGAPSAIRSRRSAPGRAPHRALCRLRHQPEDRLQVPRPLHRSPSALDPVLLERLLEAHRRHPHWGPRRLLRLVGQRWPEAPCPVRSTVARCFQHLGLVTARRRIRRPGAAGPPVAAMDTPNAVWTTDYKGQFKLGDGQYCFPLTVADGYSRMLLACQALTSTKLVETRPVFACSGPTRRSPMRPRGQSTAPPHGPIRPACPPSSIPATTRSVA